jgi:putative phosphoesterase
VTTLGVISDTHGLLRPEARAYLKGVDRIVHAGDIDDAATLQWLVTFAPVTVVRGNCDRGAWATGLPEHELFEVEGRSIYVIHDLGCITLDPFAAGIAIVISGHSHIPKNETRDGVLYFNPGSAGPRRFGKPITLGRIVLDATGVTGQIITLPTGAG